MKKGKKVLVIGGGASGMLAAIVAARNGGEVKIYEQMQRVGKKLLATGNGRCNITNRDIKLERYHGNNREFASFGLEEFDVNHTIDFFESIGITLREEDEGKLYPYSGQASSVLDIMRYELKRLGVEEICDMEIKKIINSKDRGKLSIVLKDGSEEKADSVILATGGRANANLGSTGTGYRLATELGHKLTSTFPALVQLKSSFPYLKAAAGVKFIGEAQLFVKGTLLRKESGELLFTEYGISGPPILQLSRAARESIESGKQPILQLDMFPELTFEELKALVNKKVQLDNLKGIDFCLVGLVNKKLIPIILKLSGIEDLHLVSSQITETQLNNIVSNMKKLQLEINGTQPWRDAQVTAGGIDVMDINETTMESKRVKGLFFCGEIIDIDGDCGGFNLQWAWSSGYIAGTNSVL